jgi:hypothetical protein
VSLTAQLVIKNHRDMLQALKGVPDCPEVRQAIEDVRIDK